MASAVIVPSVRTQPQTATLFDVASAYLLANSVEADKFGKRTLEALGNTDDKAAASYAEAKKRGATALDEAAKVFPAGFEGAVKATIGTGNAIAGAGHSVTGSALFITAPIGDVAAVVAKPVGKASFTVAEELSVFSRILSAFGAAFEVSTEITQGPAGKPAGEAMRDAAMSQFTWSDQRYTTAVNNYRDAAVAFNKAGGHAATAGIETLVMAGYLGQAGFQITAEPAVLTAVFMASQAASFTSKGAAILAQYPIEKANAAVALVSQIAVATMITAAAGTGNMAAEVAGTGREATINIRYTGLGGTEDNYKLIQKLQKEYPEVADFMGWAVKF